LSRKLKNFISVRVELAGGLDYRRLKECPWIPFFVTVTILEISLCSVACAFEGLDSVYLEAFKQILRQNYSEAE